MLRIGIQVDFAGGYGRSVLRGVMHYANLRNDWEFVMPPTYSNSAQPIEKMGVQGVISMLHTVSVVQRLRRAKIPFVNMARTLSTELLAKHRVPTVLPDDRAIGQKALKYFWDRHFRSFGYYGHPTGVWSRIRGDAFVAACQEAGGEVSAAYGVDEVPGEWVASLPRPCAILACNDRYAWYVIDACRENGIKVPEEMIVLGVDNDPLLDEMCRPTISSVDLAAEQIGFEAARMMDQLLTNQPLAKSLIEIPPGEIITRNSTDSLSIDDELVAEAAGYIRQHAAEPIRVQDVLRELAIGRRNLERRFKKVLGRSLLDEIHQAHLERAKRLLRETNLDMPHVAEQSGFTSHVRFSTLFRDRLNSTPTAYRRRYRLGTSTAAKPPVETLVTSGKEKK